jgi:hypothetical protein
VLDPFGGSGSTLIACEKAGRQARLIELDPKYVDTIIRRWQEFSGGNAVLESIRTLDGALIGAATVGGLAALAGTGEAGMNTYLRILAVFYSYGALVHLADLQPRPPSRPDRWPRLPRDELAVADRDGWLRCG